MKKRIFSTLLALCMLLCLVPTGVFAAGTDTGKAIQLVDGGTAANISGGQNDNIYFGTWDKEPIKWRVLDDNTNTGESGLFLLSDALLGTGWSGDVYFDNSGNIRNAWQSSTAKTWCNDFYDKSFSNGEQGAVLATTKSDEAFTKGTGGISFDASENILNGDKVFFLSAEEAENSAYGFTDDNARIANYGNSAGVWWLRSPYTFPNYAGYAGVVFGNGPVYAYVVSGVWAARPAFNLNLNSVLFTSAAVGGKADTAVDKNLTAVTGYTGSEWKLTLKDSSRSFSADVNGQTSASVPAGGTVEITYTGAETGGNEYVSAMLCDSNDNVLYYGNIAQGSAGGTASIAIPADLAPGNYTLKVFSEQCNGDKQTDYASEFQNIDLNVLLQEETPNAVFTATNNNSGTLSGVDTSMKYSVDGGTTWNDITGETMEITGVTAEQDVKVYKPGDGTTTSDSKVQTIDITQAAQPTGIDKADCTTSKQNNGQIAGVDTTMEYKLSTGSGWTTINANPLTGLTDGTYEVRVKASGTVLASTAVTVTIGAHTCVAQGDWQRNGTGHWKLCACGAKVEEAAHSGGTATCTKKAECTVCGAEYGAIDPANHTDLKHIDAKDATVAEEGNIEYWYCEGCSKYFSDKDGTKEIAKADTVTPKLPPKITAGDGAAVTQGEKKELSFTSDASFADFLRVELDGTTLDEKNYTKREGSTIITLNRDFVATLSVGEHTLAIVSKSGTATAKFTVKAKPTETATPQPTVTPQPTAQPQPTVQPVSPIPRTGDTANPALWFALLIVSGLALAAIFVLRRKGNRK